MAQTSRGIKYPDDYSAVADIPADLQEMAESINDAIGDGVEEATYDDTALKARVTIAEGKISDIEAEQTVQNANIIALQTENARLKATLKTTSYTGETFTLDKTAEMEFEKPPLPGGNTKQNTTTGKNKLDVLSYKTAGTEETINGVKYKVNNDGSILVNGTATALSSFVIYGSFSSTDIIQELDVSKQYRVSSKVSVSDINFFLRTYDDNSLESNVSGTTFTGKTGITGAYIQVESGKTINNMTVYPQLEEGTAETTYEKYTGGKSSPNPEYLQTINNVTGNINVSIDNGNIFNRTNASSNKLLAWGTGEEAPSTGSIVSDYISTIPFTNIVSNYKFYIFYFDGSKNYIGNSEDLRTSAGVQYTTISVNKTARYFRLLYRADTGGNPTDMTIQNIMVNRGTTLLSYIEHKSQAKIFPLGTERLMLGDYLSDDGIHHVRSQKVFDGSNDEEWGDYSSISDDMFQIKIACPCKNREGLCNILPVTQDYSITEHVVIAGALTVIFVHLNKSRLETQDAAGFKAWLSNHPLTFEYNLPNEMIVPYTQEQQTAYNEIKKRLSYEGQTNVYSTNETSPIFDVEACQSSKLLFDDIYARLELLED